MVTAKQVILYTNVLPQPPLIQTKLNIGTAEKNFKSKLYSQGIVQKQKKVAYCILLNILHVKYLCEIFRNLRH